MMGRDKRERGERGPVGDHGQDGRTGATGKTGSAGEKGNTGATGANGQFLSHRKGLAGFLFVVVAFLALAYNTEQNINELQQINNRRSLFLEEFCANEPDIAPKACARPRPQVK